MPALAIMLARAITAPRRSAGARHWISALSGTNTSPAEKPTRAIRRIVPARRGPIRPNASVLRVSPIAPSGTSPYSTLDAESRPAATEPTPIPMPIAARGRPVCHSRQSERLHRVGQERRRDQAGDRPDEDLAADRQPEDPVGADGRPAESQGLEQVPLGAGRRNRGNPERRDQPEHRDARQHQAPEPGPSPREVEDDTARDRPADEGEVRPHLEQTVARRELLMRQDLGKDSVLGGAEERGLNPEQSQDRHRRGSPRRMKNQEGRAQRA